MALSPREQFRHYSIILDNPMPFACNDFKSNVNKPVSLLLGLSPPITIFGRFHIQKLASYIQINGTSSTFRKQGGVCAIPFGLTSCIMIIAIRRALETLKCIVSWMSCLAFPALCLRDLKDCVGCLIQWKGGVMSFMHGLNMMVKRCAVQRLFLG